MPTPRIAVPVIGWPDLDRAGWEATNRPGDQFDPPGRAAGWRPSTRDTNERSYGHWLKFLGDTGRIEPGLAPHMRCTPANIAAYLQSLKDRGLAPLTAVKRIHGLNSVLRAIRPGADLDYLDDLERRLKRACATRRLDWFRRRIFPSGRWRNCNACGASRGFDPQSNTAMCSWWRC